MKEEGRNETGRGRMSGEFSRREFIISSIAGVAHVGQGFSPADAGKGQVRGAASTIGLRVTGTRGRAGADLAVEETQRTATLLGTRVMVGEVADAVAIDLDAGSLVYSGTSYFVAASAGAREHALASWRRNHTGPAQTALEWHAGLTKYGAEQLNDRFLRRVREPMDAPAWIAWMLIKIAVESRLRAEPIATGRYDGHKGMPLKFGRDGHLIQPLCIVSMTGELLDVVQ